MNKKSVLYKKIISKYYQMMGSEFEINSLQYATLNGLSKIPYAIFLALDPHENYKISHSKAKSILGKHFSLSIKDIARDIRNYFIFKKQNKPYKYTLVGFKTNEVANFLDTVESDCINFIYPNILLCKLRSYKHKKTYKKFFLEFFKEVSTSDLNFEKQNLNLIDRISSICGTAHEFASVAILKLKEIDNKILITSAGNWKNRTIASVGSSCGIETYGFPHGNIHLTAFDEDQHIENDVLPVCNNVYAYSYEHKRDWEDLCKNNSRVILNTKVLLLPTKNEIIFKRKKKQKLNMLICGYPYNSRFYPFLVNYNQEAISDLETTIYDKLKKLNFVNKVSYKPHPMSKIIPQIEQTNQLSIKSPLENFIHDYDIVVLPHFKTSVFGYCIENKIPFLVFRDPEVSISKRSLKKMKSLGGVVDMVNKKKRFHFSEENFLKQLGKIKNIYYA